MEKIKKCVVYGNYFRTIILWSMIKRSKTFKKDLDRWKRIKRIKTGDLFAFS